VAFVQTTHRLEQLARFPTPHNGDRHKMELLLSTTKVPNNRSHVDPNRGWAGGLVFFVHSYRANSVSK